MKRDCVEVMEICTLDNLSLNTSILVRSSMILVRVNQRELATDSNTIKDSSSRFYR